MFSNKFDVGIVYVFKVGIIRITFKFLLTRNNILFIKFLIPIFWQVFCCLHFSLNFELFFPYFPNKNFQLNKNQNKKHMLVRGRGG
jgi:hypothetical protein